MSAYFEETNIYDDYEDFLIVKYPALTLIVAGIYVWLVKVAGPSFMAKRQPYNITNLVKIYNVAQVLLNGYAVAKLSFTPQIFRDIWVHHCHYKPVPDNSTYPDVFVTVNFIMLIKYVDLLDSMFMVMKKKFNQLSFLHVFHHSIVIIMFSIGLKYREGLVIPLIVLNSFVHVNMYFYYFLTGFESMKKPLSKWKHLITRLQLVQFVIMLAFMMIGYIRGCTIGTTFATVSYGLICFFIYLFGKFYVDAYMKKRRDSVKPKH